MSVTRDSKSALILVHLSAGATRFSIEGAELDQFLNPSGSSCVPPSYL